MTGFLLVIVGCLECMEGHRVVGVFPTWEAAQAAVDPDDDAGSREPWIIDLSAVPS